VQEQCLPFTAATAVGLIVPAPFAWGYCAETAVPATGRPFRSPVPRRELPRDDRVFYVVDDPDYCFVGNRFRVPPDIESCIGAAPIPGLSFFHRADQQNMIKLHLPYGWRTDEGTATLFTAPVNRKRADGLCVVAGLVETDWYVNPVNLVLELPATGDVHVEAGEPVAQAVQIEAAARRPTVEFVGAPSDEGTALLEGVARWRRSRVIDRSAYKRGAKSRHGMIAP